MNDRRPEVLVAGWFSFPDGHGTAGDVLAADTVTDWLDEAGVAFDLAGSPPFAGTVHWRSVEPDRYSIVVFVCGPFEQKPYEAEFLRRFERSRIIGMNLTLNEAPTEWNPFDLLVERDSPTTGRPDLVFGQTRRPIPVCGVCLVEDYPEGDTATANAAIEELVSNIEAAVIPIDTRLDDNGFGLRSKEEVEAVIATMDVVVTTRLHGMVLALKNGVPVVPIDPRPGGGKLITQARSVGWPVVFAVDRLTSTELWSAFNFCLTPEARKQAQDAAVRARASLDPIRTEFLAAVTNDRWPTDVSLSERSRTSLFDLYEPGQEPSDSEPSRSGRFGVRSILDAVGHRSTSRSRP